MKHKKVILKKQDYMESVFRILYIRFFQQFHKDTNKMKIYMKKV